MLGEVEMGRRTEEADEIVVIVLADERLPHYRIKRLHAIIPDRLSALCCADFAHAMITTEAGLLALAHLIAGVCR